MASTEEKRTRDGRKAKLSKDDSRRLSYARDNISRSIAAIAEHVGKKTAMAEMMKDYVARLNELEGTDYVIRVSSPYLSNWTSGTCSPDLDSLYVISKTFGVPLQDMFEGTVSFGGGSTAAPLVKHYEGQDATAEATIPAEVTLRFPSAHLRTYLLEDDSMDRMIPEGAVALVQLRTEGEKIDPRVPYLVEAEGKATVRLVSKKANGYLLTPASTDETLDPVTHRNDEEGNPTVKVVGKVVWFTMPTDFDWSDRA